VDLSLHVGAETIKPVSAVRDLGVILDDELTMKPHISKVTSVTFYHIGRLKKVRSILGAEITASLISEPARLLQFGTGKSTSVHCCTTTACSERRGTTHQRPPPARSRDVSSSRSTLAADYASCHI